MRDHFQACDACRKGWIKAHPAHPPAMPDGPRCGLVENDERFARSPAVRYRDVFVSFRHPCHGSERVVPSSRTSCSDIGARLRQLPSRIPEAAPRSCLGTTAPGE
jgi:hypothetical protein